jgi:hypothetical protein
MRSGLARAAAAVALLAVLAGGAPAVSAPPDGGHDRAAHQDRNMGAPPGPKASAVLPAAPLDAPAPATAPVRLAAHLPLLGERPARKARVAPAPPKSPPAVLRI